MNNKHICILVILSIAFYFTTSQAQEWSKEQKEVWTVIERNWDLGQKEDLENLMRDIHPEFLGWPYDEALPGSKESGKKWSEYNFQTRERIIYEIKPVNVQVHGNMAFAHYYYSAVDKDSEGKLKKSNGRWTDVLVKEGDRWMFITWHGGKTSKE